MVLSGLCCGGKTQGRPRPCVTPYYYLKVPSIWCHHTPETAPIGLAVGMILSKSEAPALVRLRSHPPKGSTVARQHQQRDKDRLVVITHLSPARTLKAVRHSCADDLNRSSLHQNTFLKAEDSPGLGEWPVPWPRWSKSTHRDLEWNDPTFSPAQSRRPTVDTKYT